MTYPAAQVPREPTTLDLLVKVSGPWRESISRGTLTVCAIVAPLLAALGLFVGSTEREAPDIAVLVGAGVLLPALRFGRRGSVQSRAIAAILTMLATALYLTARAGFAGANGVILTACVLGAIIFGRRLGMALIGVSALAQLIIGALVVKRVLLIDPMEVDPCLYRSWIRMTAATSLLAVLLALVVDFVIRRIEANTRAIGAALTDLRGAHDALRENEERYRSLVDHSLDGVLLTKRSGEALEANPAACQLLQRTPEEIREVGRAGILDVEDSRLAPMLEERRLTGKVRGEINLIRKDGKRVPVEITSAVFRDRFGEPRTSISIRDLTDRRRAEKEQRILAELGAVLSPLRYESSISDVAHLVARDLADLVVFFLVQPDGELQRVAAATRDPAQEWIADAIMTALRSTVRADHGARQVVRDRKPIITQFTPESFEKAAENPEHLRVLRAMRLKSSMVVPLSIGDICVGALGLASSSQAFEEADLPLMLEIGRRCALFIENARLHRSEKRAIQARDEVLAIVAHDLRSPLASMVFLLAALRRIPGEPERRSMESVEAAENAARRMSRILEDLLDVTKLESGRFQLSRTRISPPEIIAEIGRSQGKQVDSRSLELRTVVAPDVPDVWADRSRVLQVFENLVGNAIKFTAKGSITLGARAEGGEVVFWVADTGIGIAADDIPHVFDRFWQARKAERSGAGLGLAIVQEIVQAHGGRLWVASELGSGSTFFFTLPAMPVSPLPA
jgi:PAS domain S-box-containing protein